RFLHFPTVDGCNATLNSPIVICCFIFNVILIMTGNFIFPVKVFSASNAFTILFLVSASSTAVMLPIYVKSHCSSVIP
ncbi:hypothetical protein L9F63_015382, partial [Diploptera punctata]